MIHHIARDAEAKRDKIICRDNKSFPVVQVDTNDEDVEVNDKGTIRFPLSRPVPVRLIGRIAKFRLTEVMALKNSG